MNTEYDDNHFGNVVAIQFECGSLEVIIQGRSFTLTEIDSLISDLQAAKAWLTSKQKQDEA